MKKIIEITKEYIETLLSLHVTEIENSEESAESFFSTLAPSMAGTSYTPSSILKYFNTANIVPSTLSVTTSFLAVYLTFRRSPYFAVAYATNDIVLIILWILASFSDIRYISVVVCFVSFLLNDIYGFISWQKMKTRQSQTTL